MGSNDTPPASPRQDDLNEMLDDQEQVGEENAIEIIDLDEIVGSDEEIDEDGTELGTVMEEGSSIVQDVKDNAQLAFKEHSKSGKVYM